MPNGEKISQEFEDSFVYSVDILREIKEKSNNKEDGVSFSIRVKEVKDIMPVVEELNKEGLIPIGEFESVKDILKISDISKEGAKSITIIIAVLGVAITFVITIITANLRKYEFAVLKINGYTKASLFTLNIAEGILISLVSIILFGIIYTPINTLSLKFFNVVLSGGTTIVKGIVLVFLLGVISSIISYFIVYADEVIKLDDNKIVTVKENTENIKKNSENKKEEKWKNQSINKNTINKLSIKNFKLNFVKYILAAIIIAFSTATFIASFSANEIGNKVFNDFKEKNSFYNIGQVPKYFNGEIVNEDLKSLKDQLSEFDEIENVYYQYDIKDVSIKLNDKEIEVPIKSATALANESLSYGRIPREGKNEIAISASIVNRMVKNIQDIIGKKILFKYIDKNEIEKEITLKVKGVTNSSYQDFIISSDIEKEIYRDMGLSDQEITAISFTVSDFEKTPEIEKEMRDNNINTLTKGDEISAFLDTFSNLTKLFMFLSYIVVVVGLVVSLVILYKINNSREGEFAILSAIGYKDSFIKRILFKENIVFSLVSILLSFILVGLFNILAVKSLGYGLTINLVSIISLIFINLFITLGLSFIINHKLVKKDKVLALR